jgi:chromosome segregation ATPase
MESMENYESSITVIQLRQSSHEYRSMTSRVSELEKIVANLSKELLSINQRINNPSKSKDFADEFW